MPEETRRKMAIIGDPDILAVFKLAGATVFAARNEAEARQAIEEVSAENYGLCLIQQNFFSLLMEGKEKRARLWPVFLPFRDYRQPEDLILEGLKKMTIRATGSDSLLKRNK